MYGKSWAFHHHKMFFNLHALLCQTRKGEAQRDRERTLARTSCVLKCTVSTASLFLSFFHTTHRFFPDTLSCQEWIHYFHLWWVVNIFKCTHSTREYIFTGENGCEVFVLFCFRFDLVLVVLDVTMQYIFFYLFSHLSRIFVLLVSCLFLSHVDEAQLVATADYALVFLFLLYSTFYMFGCMCK